jgi:hypothetical protein
VSKLIVLAAIACVGAAWLLRSRKGHGGLRGRAKDAGERLRDAESRVEEAIRS